MSDDSNGDRIEFEETDVEDFAALPAHEAIQSYIRHAARASLSTRSSGCWARAAWAQSIWPAMWSSGVTWR